MGKWKDIFGSNSLFGIGSTPNAHGCFFWFDLRSDKNGKRIEQFGGGGVRVWFVLNVWLKADGGDPSISTFTTSDGRHITRCERLASIPKHGGRSWDTKLGSMDDRYTVIDDEAFEDAIDKMNAYQERQGMTSEPKELAARVESLSDGEFQRFVALWPEDRSAARKTLPFDPHFPRLASAPITATLALPWQGGAGPGHAISEF